MNNIEQQTASELLAKIQSAKSEEVVQFSTAYQMLTQGALNRVHAEKEKTIK